MPLQGIQESSKLREQGGEADINVALTYIITINKCSMRSYHVPANEKATIRYPDSLLPVRSVSTAL